jgi:hypothetical protein
MFQNWEVPSEIEQKCMYQRTFVCGDQNADCIIHGMFGSMTFRLDDTVYHRPTLNGKPVNLEDYSKLFYRYRVEETGCKMEMIESVQRCYKSVVLTLKPSVADFDSPHGKQLHVVMQQLDLNYTADGEIIWSDAFRRLKAESMSAY